MIRARAVDRSGVSIAFVAPRRVNFDTPSLKGLRLEPFRSQTETRCIDAVCAQGTVFAVPVGTAPEITTGEGQNDRRRTRNER